MSAQVYIVSGFLGSGKTTLINNILKSAPQDMKISVLVNDFGTISIDGRLINADPASILDLSGGCICCNMSIELIACMRFVLETRDPDVILIESTGLAVPQEIARLAVSPFFEGKVTFGGIITLVDAAGLDLEEYPLIAEQLKEANVVVLNKVDLVDSEKLEKVRSKIRQFMPAGCGLRETQFARVRCDEILSKGSCGVPAPEAASAGRMDTTAGFSTLCFASNTPVDIDQLMQLYNAYGSKIIRSKGFLLTEKGTVELQFSVDGMEVKTATIPVQRTELVLITREKDQDLLKEAFKRVLGGVGRNR